MKAGAVECRERLKAAATFMYRCIVIPAAKRRANEKIYSLIERKQRKSKAQQGFGQTQHRCTPIRFNIVVCVFALPSNENNMFFAFEIVI